MFNIFFQHFPTNQPKFHDALRRKQNSETKRAWQQQRKQLLLTDNEDVLTYLFQQRQRRQPNFLT